MVSADDREAWTDFVVRVCAGETRSVEVSITTLDGVTRVLEAAAVPSPAEFGRSPSLLMVLRDVTERKRLEAAVEKATELSAAEPEPGFGSDDRGGSRSFSRELPAVAEVRETSHEANQWSSRNAGRCATSKPIFIESRGRRDRRSRSWARYCAVQRLSTMRP